MAPPVKITHHDKRGRRRPSAPSYRSGSSSPIKKMRPTDLARHEYIAEARSRSPRPRPRRRPATSWPLLLPGRFVFAAPPSLSGTRPRSPALPPRAVLPARPAAAPASEPEKKAAATLPPSSTVVTTITTITTISSAGAVLPRATIADTTTTKVEEKEEEKKEEKE
ncbi:hypothetical protein Q7P36_003404 [Cladosporium allicinum]